MDVRCESCHTEYELDDGSVNESGTDVQCTFCGHTFTVFRRDALPATGASVMGAEYVLETADGRVHRLRDLTVLQKWIIERRVTRSDRLSQGGQNWTRLGALEDLAPFFDVVDEADRARASVARASNPELAAARAQGGRTSPGAPVAAGGTVLGHSSPSLPIMPTVTPRGGERPVAFEPAAAPRGGERKTNRSLELMAVEAPFDGAEPETALIQRPSRGWWKLLVTFGVAGGIAYAGIRALPGMMTPAPATVATNEPSAPAVVPQTDPAAGAAAVPGAVSGTGVDPGAAVAGTGDPVAAVPGTGVPGTNVPGPGVPGTVSGTSVPDPGTAAGTGTAPLAAGAAAAPPTPAPTPSPAIAEAPAAAAPPVPAETGQRPGAAAERTPPTKPADRAARPRQASPAEAPSYEGLLAQADKLLGNGANERALRLYERALVLKPGAPDALTGIGYAHLDRGRTGPAIEYFNRASAGSPHAPALFGLGQAYRAAGDYNRARETYRRYLSVFPNGPEASAAERQLRSMPTAEPGGGGGGGEVTAPASILQEGGAQEPGKPREGGGATTPANPAQPFDAPVP
jgi:predicted Zn finger-like uncharacterized protein